MLKVNLQALFYCARFAGLTESWKRELSMLKKDVNYTLNIQFNY